MTDQVEVKEQVRWEDLEVEEEPRYFEGLGDAAAEMHQYICEEISRRKELKVTEKTEGCFCIDGYPECPECEVDPAKPGSDVTALTALTQATEGMKTLAQGAAVAQGILLVYGISAEEFAQAMEGRARAALELEMDYLNTPVLGAVDWREANKRLPRISEMVARINAFCTPSRNILTGQGND